jgi:ferric enterobactin receptor
MKTQHATHRVIFCLSLLVLMLTVLLPLSLLAQGRGPGSVSGSLRDAATGQAIPFSDVLFLRAADSTLVTGAQTEEDGSFKAEHLALGSYILRAQDLNYTTGRTRVTLTAEFPTVQLPPLKLHATTTKLGEVVVQGEKATVVEELGKRVINVEKDLSSVGGTAVNVLQNVPSVAVDASGVVSLRGSTNLTILIDGKPSGTTNGGTGPRLDQIPASRISQVEVMTNPSAKYNASGSGVINIITKKEKKDGTNGQIGLLVGTGEKYAPSLSLSRHQGPANWSLRYNGKDRTFNERNNNTQTATLPTGELVRTTQQGYGHERHYSQSVDLGLDYKLSDEQSLSVSIQPSLEGENNTSGQDLTSQVNGGPQLNQNGQQQVDVDVKIMKVISSYTRTWKAHAGRELSATLGWVGIAATAPFGQQITGGPSQRQDFVLDDNIFFGQLDYTHPLADGKGRIETGLNMQGNQNQGSGELLAAPVDRPSDYQRDPIRSMAYHFRELLPAAYATYQHTLGHGYSMQGGVRAEYTDLHGAVEDGTGRVDLGYLSLFPSATLARDLGEKAGQQKVQISYARRIERPEFMQQLPFRLYEDARNYRLGNPNLRAEFSHNVELGYQLNLEGGASFSATGYGRFTQDVWQTQRTIDTTATRLNGAGIVTAETFRNLGNTTNLGLELTWAQPLTKWWRVNASSSVYHSEVAANAAAPQNRRLVSATGRLSSNFTPLPTLDVQLTGSWTSTTLTVQGRRLPTGNLEVALRKRLFQDRAALTLRVADILNTQVNRNEIETGVLSLQSYNKRETRVGWLGFTWYLGATKPGKRIEAAPQGGGGGFGG